jgi:hypothetical protein
MLYSLPMPVIFDPASYQQMSDGALLRIAMDRAELTPEAGAALEAELAKRGLGEEQQREFAINYRAQTTLQTEQQGSRHPMLPWTASFEGYYGKRDVVKMHNREQFQTTMWFCLFWIPLIPEGTFIVHRTTTTWLGLFDEVRKIRKVPLDWEQVVRTWAVAALVLVGLYFFGPWLLLWWVKR